uniref:Small ribosomal subunit protein uS8c n=1 Tax=Callipsygma wilsonis TaxID=2320807 RepID=A0A386AZZ8_9CHLO|nr:ribosomal protein S8 [Callipsygma wilsonis]AYC65020.1 ribosomal protein S8 [Callipsygma wilsonis]
MTDSISDFLTRIRNANFLKKKKVFVSSTKINLSLVKIFLRHGFLKDFKQVKNKKILCFLKYKKNKPIILQLKRLSKPGCRLYVKKSNIPKIFGGIIFLSTSKGILSDREAFRLNVGGEILGFIS